MDAESFRNLLLVAQFVGGGFCIILWRMFSDVKKRADDTAAALVAFQITVSQTYTSDIRMAQLLAPLTDAIRRMELKLDTKQDKV